MALVTGQINLELKNFDQLKRILNVNRFKVVFKKAVKEATLHNALIAADAIKIAIVGGAIKPENHPLTKIVKRGSNVPLMDTGELSQSIMGRAVTWNLAAIGVMKEKTKGKNRNFATKKAALGQIALAAILHEGIDIEVSDKMRRFFAVMAMKHPGKVKPLKASTTVISIPGRPFLEEAFASTLIAIYRRNWENAIDETFRLLKQGV